MKEVPCSPHMEGSSAWVINIFSTFLVEKMCNLDRSLKNPDPKLRRKSGRRSAICSASRSSPDRYWEHKHPIPLKPVQPLPFCSLLSSATVAYPQSEYRIIPHGMTSNRRLAGFIQGTPFRRKKQRVIESMSDRALYLLRSLSVSTYKGESRITLPE